MILAKDKTGREQKMTEKEFSDAQRLLPQYEWEKIKDIDDVVEVDDLVIEVIEPNDDIDRAELEKDYPRSWKLRKEFIAILQKKFTQKAHY